MHIADGALSLPVLAIGAAGTVVGLGLGLRKLTTEQIPVTGMLAAVFFVASVIHVPLGPSSVHLIMNGLAGVVLGWAAFPALFIGLLLQAVFFGFGGVTVLGINALNIAMPAVMVGVLFRPLLSRSTPNLAALWGGLAGFGAICLSTIMVALSLAFSGEAFVTVAKLVVVSHIPVMLLEGAITAAALYLICKVKPEMIGAVPLSPATRLPSDQDAGPDLNQAVSDSRP